MAEEFLVSKLFSFLFLWYLSVVILAFANGIIFHNTFIDTAIIPIIAFIPIGIFGIVFFIFSSIMLVCLVIMAVKCLFDWKLE